MADRALAVLGKQGRRLAPTILCVAYFAAVIALIHRFSLSDALWRSIDWLGQAPDTPRGFGSQCQLRIDWAVNGGTPIVLSPRDIAEITAARVKSALACSVFLVITVAVVISNVRSILRAFSVARIGRNLAGTSMVCVVLAAALFALFRIVESHGHFWAESFLKVIDAPGLRIALDVPDPSDLIDWANTAAVVGLGSLLLLTFAWLGPVDLQDSYHTDQFLVRRARALDAMLLGSSLWLLALTLQIAAYYNLASVIGDLVYDYNGAGTSIRSAMTLLIGTIVSGALAVLYVTTYSAHVADVGKNPGELLGKSDPAEQAARRKRMGVWAIDVPHLVRLLAIAAPSLAAVAAEVLLER